jgi:hypothetical protein
MVFCAIRPGCSCRRLHAEDNKVFANGNQVAGGNLKSDTSILRGVHYMDIGGFIGSKEENHFKVRLLKVL